MTKLLIIIVLLIVCAALEMPEDYQWDQATMQEVALTTQHRAYIPAQTSVNLNLSDTTTGL